jgi:ApbE superfamily uncharacterized protein (UPF0280 family)
MHAYQPRSYRHWIKDKDLISFTAAVRESDLYVRATRNLSRKTLRVLLKHRASLEGYIAGHPEFLTSLEPVSVGGDAPQIVKSMAEAAGRVGVGPMAAVAGAIAEYVGAELCPLSREVIVENGGKIAVEIPPAETPLGICTSSGTVGHSLSFGCSDACIVVSRSASLADAAATAIGNRIQSTGDISPAVDFARTVDGIAGAVLIKDDRIAFWGELKIVPLGG